MLGPPVWFEDAQAAPVRELLCWFVRQLTKREHAVRQRSLTRKLNRATIPALFQHRHLEELEFLWEIIEELSSPAYGIWTLQQNLKFPTARAEHQTTLVFNYAAENVVRVWLKLPLVEPQEAAWRETVNSSVFTQLPLRDFLIHGYPGVYPPEQLLTFLVKLNDLAADIDADSLTWRQLSARCFAGDSKYLESFSRQQWVLQLFPALVEKIQPRQLLFDAHLVDQAKGILLVENQDTFCWLSALSQGIECARQLHLVYSGGFQTSAARARNPEYATFHFNGDLMQRERFFSYWFSTMTEHELPIFFWGDLDFSGLAIIKSLRQVFPNLVAWQPGYAPMATAISSGGGHLPEHAGKQKQLNPGASGCPYSDTYLLPLLENAARFLDQEWVTENHLLPRMART